MPAAPASVVFTCCWCYRPVRAEPATRGELGRCPSCRVPVSVPWGQEVRPASVAASLVRDPGLGRVRELLPPTPAPQSARPRRSASGRIELSCPRCQRRGRAPAGSSGRKARCPGCWTALRVPRPDPARPRRRARRAAARPTRGWIGAAIALVLGGAAAYVAVSSVFTAHY